MIGFVSSGRTGQREREVRRQREVRHGPVALLVAAALGVALAGCTGSGATPQVVYITPGPASGGVDASSSVAASVTAAPSATQAPTLAPTFAATATPAPGPCNASNLTATVQSSGGISWQSGAGHRMATFVLKNVGPVACNVKAKSQPLLLNGDDSILILGPAPGSSATLMLAPGGTVHTIVQTGNLCGAPTIIAPVKVAFMMPGGVGLVVATPLSASDEGGMPPCMGDPSTYSGSIDMQPWAA